MPVTEQLIIELQAKVQQYNKEVANAGSVTKKTQKDIETSFNKITQSMMDASVASRQAGNNFGMFGRQAGQAGIQIQQLVGQVQGGQSFFLALSQQAADLGIVLGAPLLGAIAGIGAAIAGTLLPSLFEAEKGFEDLAEKVKESADEIRNLTQAQREATLLELQNQLREAEESLSDAREGIKDAKEDLEDLSSSQFGDGPFGFLDPVTDKFGELTGATKDAREELINYTAQADTAKQTIESLEATIDKLANAPDYTPTVPDNEQELREYLQLAQDIYSAELDDFLKAIEAKEAATESFNQKKSQQDLAWLQNTDSFYKADVDAYLKSLIMKEKALRDSINLQSSIQNELKALQAGEVAEQESIESGESPEIAKIRENAAIAIELEKQRFEAKKEILLAGNQSTEELEQLHQDNLTAIRKKGAEQAKKIADLQSEQARNQVKREEMIKLSSARNIIRGLSTLSNAFLEDNKALNAGLIIADTASAAMSQYKIGGPPAAFAAIATGAAQLAANNSASKGGGSVAGVSGGFTDTVSNNEQQELPQVATTETDITREPQEMTVILTAEGLDNFVEGIAVRTVELERDGRIDRGRN